MVYCVWLVVLCYPPVHQVVHEPYNAVGQYFGIGERSHSCVVVVLPGTGVVGRTGVYSKMGRVGYAADHRLGLVDGSTHKPVLAAARVFCAGRPRIRAWSCVTA